MEKKKVLMQKEIANMLENIHVFRRVLYNKNIPGGAIHARQLPLLEYVMNHKDCTQVEVAKALHVSAASIALSTKHKLSPYLYPFFIKTKTCP